MKCKSILLAIFWAFSYQVIGQSWIFHSGMVEFSIKNAGLKVNGSISGLSAKVEFNPDNPKTAYMEGQVETKTIETGINLRNKHLKKEEYFNVEKFPHIRMKLQSLEGSGNQFKAVFVLTIKGITKTLSLPVQFKPNGKTGTLSTLFSINRLDFGVGGSSWTMGDQVEVNIQFEIKKP